MIFVTLGTQDKSFRRLLVEIDRLIEKGIIKDRVVVQAGDTEYKSKYMEIFDLLPMDEFESYMKKADLVITHGGIGSILTALNYEKKVIAVPRLAKYKEHTNDHQLQIVEDFSARKYIMGALSVDELEKIFSKVEKFKPQKYKSNNETFVSLIQDYIEKDNHISWYHRYYYFICLFILGLLMSVCGSIIYLCIESFLSPFLAISIILGVDCIYLCRWNQYHLWYRLIATILTIVVGNSGVYILNLKHLNNVFLLILCSVFVAIYLLVGKWKECDEK